MNRPYTVSKVFLIIAFIVSIFSLIINFIFLSRLGIIPSIETVNIMMGWVVEKGLLYLLVLAFVVFISHKRETITLKVLSVLFIVSQVIGLISMFRFEAPSWFRTMLLLIIYLSFLLSLEERKAFRIIGGVASCLIIITSCLDVIFFVGIWGPYRLINFLSTFFSNLSTIFLALGFFTYFIVNRHQLNDNEYNKQIMTKKQSIPIEIILTIITFGIYQFIWYYRIIRTLTLIHKENRNRYEGELMCISVVPFYAAYWFYTRSNHLSKNSPSYGVEIPNNRILYMILALFLPILSIALFQQDLNQVIEGLQIKEKEFNHPQQYNKESIYFKEPTPQHNVFTIIEQLNTLKEKGLLSDDEFNEKKQELLSRL